MFFRSNARPVPLSHRYYYTEVTFASQSLATSHQECLSLLQADKGALAGEGRGGGEGECVCWRHHRATRVDFLIVSIVVAGVTPIVWWYYARSVIKRK